MPLIPMIELYFRLALSLAGLLLASAIVVHPSLTEVGVVMASTLYGASFGTWTKALGLAS